MTDEAIASAEEETAIALPQENGDPAENAAPQESGDSTAECVRPYERGDWRERVDTFAAKYPIAESYAEEIGERIAGDDSLAQREDCLEAALVDTLIAHRKEAREYAEDEAFLAEYVYGNDTVRERIIDEYLNGLYESRKPVTIDGKGRSVLTLPRRPSNIAEAGKLAENMFNNRRK